MSLETSWHRERGASVLCSPWRNVNIDGELRMVKFFISSSGYDFFITIQHHLYHETISNEAASKRSQVCIFKILSCSGLISYSRASSKYCFRFLRFTLSVRQSVFFVWDFICAVNFHGFKRRNETRIRENFPP